MPPDTELAGSTLRRVIDALPRALVVTDGSGTIRLWSAAAERLYGWPASSVLGRSIFEILEDDAPDGPAILETLLAGGRYRSQRSLRHRDGSTIHVFSITTALLSADGSIEFVVGATDDVAELAALEVEAAGLSEHLRLALDAGGFGTWRWDMASGLTTWDAEMEHIFGLDPGSFDGTFEAYTAMVHADDLGGLLEVLDEAVASKGQYRIEHRLVTPSGDVRWIEGAGRATVDALGNVTGTIGCAHDITERAEVEQERERLRSRRDRTGRTDAALAGLGRRLAASISVDQVLAVIAEDAPRVLGARRVEVALALDAERLTIGGAHARVVPLAEAGPLAAALTQVETILDLDGDAGVVGDTWRDEVPDDADDPEVRGSLVASPLYDDIHDPMGVLVLTWGETTTLDEVDLNAIETLSRLCGQAIVRSQLAGHTQELADLAASMAAARSTTEVAHLLREHGTNNLRATVTSLRVIDHESSTLQAVLPSPVSPEIAKRYERIPLDAELPLTDAVRDQEPVWIPDLDDYRARYPDAAEQAERAGLGAAAALPLCDSDSDAMGAMALAWPAAMRFDHRLHSRLTTLADLAAQTLERVRLYEAEHAVVTSMQRRLLAPLPTVAGLDMAAFYEPAAAAVGMGGDWYEAVPLPDGSVVVILGDVVGHGVNAVAAMAQIQHLLTGLLHAGAALGEVLGLANTMIAGSEPTFATALLLHIDPAGGRVGYSSAGHLWPLVRHADGTVQVLDGNQQPMFGLAIEASDLVYVDVDPGTLVLAYTDGLVERRGETIDDGIARLARRLERFQTTGELNGRIDELVGQVRGDDPDRRATVDDVAAVLVRISAREQPGGR